MSKTQTEMIPFNVVKFESIRGGSPRMQIQCMDDLKLHEVTFAISQNRETGELQWDVVRHFTDPESQAWFPDSEPWPTREEE